MNEMNEDNKSLDASAGAESGAKSPLRNSLVTRRRFAKAGAASSVVLGSLVAKPVLAYTDKQIYHCTVSGQLSGNFSSHPDVIDCKTLGRSPGYWKNNGPWPSPTVQGALSTNMCSNTANSTPRGTYFNGFSSGGSTLANAFKQKPVSSICTVYNLKEAAFGTCSAKATMLQVLNTGGGLNDNNIAAFGRATVASLLNALKGGGYPLTPKQVIDMFNAVVTVGSYKLNATKSWDMAQVQTYFESLYGGA